MAIVAGLIALLLVAACASVNPALHGCLHEDHPTPSHDCLACALEQGLGEAPGVVPPVTPVERPAFVLAVPRETFFALRDLTLHPERGPPVPA